MKCSKCNCEGTLYHGLCYDHYLSNKYNMKMKAYDIKKSLISSGYMKPIMRPHLTGNVNQYVNPFKISYLLDDKLNVICDRLSYDRCIIRIRRDTTSEMFIMYKKGWKLYMTSEMSLNNLKVLKRSDFEKLSCHLMAQMRRSNFPLNHDVFFSFN